MLGKMFDHTYPGLNAPDTLRTHEGLCVDTTKQFHLSYKDAVSNPDEFRKRLSEQKLVVVTDVIPTEINDQYVTSYTKDFKLLMNDAYKELHPSALAPEGWGGKTVMDGHSMPCTIYAQKRRLNTRVQKLFAKLFGIKELVCSMEGSAVQYVEWLKNKNGHSTTSMSSHRIVAFQMSGKNYTPLHCIQAQDVADQMKRDRHVKFKEPVMGCIFNTDQTHKIVNKGKKNQRVLTSAGMIFAPGYDKMPFGSPNISSYGKHWQVLNDEQLKECIPHLIHPDIPKGSLVLWTGRTVYNDTLGHKAFYADNSGKDIARGSQYVCWLPEKFVDPTTIANRLKFAKSGFGDKGPCHMCVPCKNTKTKGTGAKGSKVVHKWNNVVDEQYRTLTPEMTRGIIGTVHD